MDSDRREGVISPRRGVVLPSDSEQLELELKDARLRIPWGGRSPRSLTRCGKLFILAEIPAGGLIQVDPQQFTTFLKGNPYGT